MITNPMSVLELYPVRKTKKQKKKFRADVRNYFTQMGYPVQIEEDSFGVRNVVVGEPNTAKVLVTAHYDTPAGLPFPNIVTPCHWLPFVLYQLLITTIILAIPFGISFGIGKLINNISVEAALFSILVICELAWMLVGPANKNNANDNTSGVVAVLQIAKELPAELRNKVCFVLFDLEEAGLIGSASYAKKHKDVVDGQIVLNMDCVGDGDNFVFFPNPKVLKNKELIEWLSLVECEAFDNKNLAIRKKGFSYYPSDQKNFIYGVGISSLQKIKNGWLYLGKVHTKRDTILEEKNIEFLSENIIQLIQSVDGIEIPIVKQNKVNALLAFVLLYVFGYLIGTLIGAMQYGF